MSDECFLPPGQTMRVSILTVPRNHTVVRHPFATGCAICRQPWHEHEDATLVRCEKCGVEFDYDCYFGVVVTAEENRRWDRWCNDEFDDTDPEFNRLTFLCHGCRS